MTKAHFMQSFGERLCPHDPGIDRLQNWTIHFC